MAVEQVFGAETRWHAEIEAAPSKVLETRWPGVPNLYDLTVADWDTVEPVAIITAGYPCFVAGTMIHTARGYVPIEDVAVGDKVLTHMGRWREVTSRMRKPDAPLWRVLSGLPITTTGEHPFYARTQGRQWDNPNRRYERTFSDPEWVEAQSLTREHRIGHVLPPEVQPTETRLEWWWLAGRYIADGYRQKRTLTGAGNPVVGDQGKVTICCGRGKEAELRDWLERAGLHATEAQARTVIKFHVTNQEFYRFTAQFGRGAAHKSFSPTGLALPDKQASALLDGYLAGDGCEVKGGQQATTVSKALALGLVILAHRARGVVASLSYFERPPTYVIEGRTVNQRSTYKVVIPRINRNAVIIGDYGWRRMTSSAELNTRADVYNISVAEDESYVADGTIVHNCQPFSAAGKRKGENDERHIWPFVREAIRRVRPRYTVLENVAGHRSLGFDRVLGDLAEDGMHVAWTSLRAADVGAPHGRERVFLLVTDSTRDTGRVGNRDSEPAANSDSPGRQALIGRPGIGDARRSQPVVSGHSPVGPLFPTPKASDGEWGTPRTSGRPVDKSTHLSTIVSLPPTPKGSDGTGGKHNSPGHADSLPGTVRELLPTPRATDGTKGGPNQRGSSGDLMLPSAVCLLPTPKAAERGDCASEHARNDPDLRAITYYTQQWGKYEPAIRRWEHVAGPAPSPTEPNSKGNPRLSARFAEWMMGLPEGWVTDIDIPRTAQLKCLGNGVVPQQAESALRWLLSAIEVAA